MCKYIKFVLAVSLLLSPCIVSAAAINVTTQQDVVDVNDGFCSLREALQVATNNATLSALQGECPAGDADAVSTDRIVLPVHGKIDLNAALGGLKIDSSLIVVGNGSTIDAGLQGRALLMIPKIGGPSPITVKLSQLLVMNGKGPDSGAGISATNTLLTLIETTLAGHVAKSGAALLLGGSSGELIINQSSIFNNTATSGSVIEVQRFKAFIINSTLAENTVRDGVVTAGSPAVIEIYNSTIANNKPIAGANIGVVAAGSSAKVILANSILVGDVGYPLCAGTVESLGHNLLGNMCTLGNKVGTDQLNQTPATVGIGLFQGKAVQGAAHYGMLDGSAINAGDGTLCAKMVKSYWLDVDQLNKKRKVNCDAGAVETYCGDGVKHAKLGEECDDADAINNSDACLTTCKSAKCGDSFIQAGVEQCDDGNMIDGDGCSSQCKIEVPPAPVGPVPAPLPVCGNAIVEAGEECDDGNKVNTDACLNTCILAKCGDGLKGNGEECDDGNIKDGDGCSLLCKIEAAPVIIDNVPINQPAAPAVSTPGQPAALSTSSGSCTLIRQ